MTANRGGAPPGCAQRGGEAREPRHAETLKGLGYSQNLNRNPGATTSATTAPAYRPRAAREGTPKLGSQHDGEEKNAATGRLRLTAGLTWADIVVGVSRRAPTAKMTISTSTRALDACFARLRLLSDWEQAFVRSIHHQRRRLCPKQRAVLERL